MHTAHVTAQNRLRESKTRINLDYGSKSVQITLKVGDGTLLFDESVRRGRSKKTSAQLIGQYVVLSVDEFKATTKCGQNAIKVHVNRLKPFI